LNGVTPPVVMTIAGSDPSCGAGLQKDLAAFSALGTRGVCAVTALTAQNPERVSGIHIPPPESVSAQIAALLDFYDVKAAKTGMLPTAEIVGAVADSLENSHFPLVVDPVLVSSSGAELMDAGAFRALTERLLRLAAWTTPNLPEAERLAGRKISSLDDMAAAAAEIAGKWNVFCVLKGGHADFLGERSVDLLAAPDGTISEFASKRIRRLDADAAHGTGCAFSAALAAELAKGANPEEAAETAKKHVAEILERG